MNERVIDRVMDLADQIREQADDAEQIGRLTDDTVKVMKSAGLIRLLQTKQYQGFEVHPPRVRRDRDGHRGAGPGRRLDRRRGGRASVPVGVRRPEGVCRDLGGRCRYLDGFPVRAAGRGQTGRRRLHLQRSLAVQLGHRPLRLSGPSSSPLAVVSRFRRRRLQEPHRYQSRHCVGRRMPASFHSATSRASKRETSA